MEALVQDLRLAVRQLVKSPVFSTIAVLTLAVGIGANTAIFSAVNTVLLRPLPYPESDRLVEIVTTGYQGVRFGVSYPDLQDIRGFTQDYTGVAAYTTQRYNLTGAGDPREVQAAAVTDDLFGVLRVSPELGRPFTAAEVRTPVALISHGLWITSFGGDPGILGHSISLDGHSYTVIGVMPGGFHFPEDDIQVWTPIGGVLDQQPGAETNRGFHFFNAVARLAPGARMTRAKSDLDLLARRLAAADSANGNGNQRREIVARGAGPGPAGPGGGGPGAGAGGRSILDNGFAASTLREQAIGDVRQPLFILLGAVGFVLLIACANAANLLLARATGRRREMAIRRALGAARGRLVRQLLTESVLLALVAGAVGVAISSWGLGALLNIWPRAIPRAAELGLDGRVLAFTFGLAVLTGIAFGLVPAWRASAPGIEESLREDGSGTTGGQRHRLQGSLVVAEVALALVLLVGAGLLVRSLIRLNDVNPGFDTRDVLAARVRLTPARYASGPQQTEFFRGLLGNLQADPRIKSASLTMMLPLSGQMRIIAFDPRTIRPDYPEPIIIVRESAVSPDFFQTFRIPLKRGRAFTPEDRVGAPSVAVVNEALVKALWPGTDPIGKQLPLAGPRGITGMATVVGVIGDLRSGALEAPARPEVYLPSLQEQALPEMWVAVRPATGSPLALAGAIRDAVRQADTEQPIGEIVTLSQLVGRQTAARRFNAAVFTLFALLAVGLALVGIAGVTAYAVLQRTRELGIRMALGARPEDVVRLLMGESLRRVALGVALGLVIAFWLTRLLASLLFDVAPRDAGTFVVTALLLAGVALLATWLPARRATRVDPMVALRTE
jgi:putative ABC transport system permease protein